MSSETKGAVPKKNEINQDQPKGKASNEAACPIQHLFQANFGHIIQDIFLMLRPGDLDNCKAVCRDWNRVMKQTVWGSNRCMRIMNLKRREILKTNWERVTLHHGFL